MKLTKRLIFVMLLVIGAVQVLADENDTSETTTTTTTQYGLSADEIAAIDVAEWERPTPNEDLMHDRWYKRVDGRVQVYDAPGGNPKRIIEEGFNYVTALQEENGWTRINGDEWVQTANLTNTNSVVSSFTGFMLPEEMSDDYTLAWSLVNQYPSPEPGAGPSERFDLILRYTPLRIYASHQIDDIRWYQISADEWVHQYRVSKVLPVAEIPEGVETDIWISIDLYEQNIIAYEGNTPVFTTLVSTGLPRWPTYEGLFRVYYRNPREYMSWGEVGDDFYSLEEVPWTMYFDEGRAIHGAYWHDGLGYRRSHGCVNLSITDSKWMYDWVREFMGGKNKSADIEEGPFVYVYSSDEYTDS